jgi:hypothetical protein
MTELGGSLSASKALRPCVALKLESWQFLSVSRHLIVLGNELHEAKPCTNGNEAKSVFKWLISL